MSVRGASLVVRSKSAQMTQSGATRRPTPTGGMVCSNTATGNQRTPNPIGAQVAVANTASTGSEQTNSIPLLNTIRFTHTERGMAVDRTRRASLLNARVKSETAALNHTQGSSAVIKKTM